MKNDKKVRSRVVELGPASEVTKGAWGHFSDEVLMREFPGLSND